MGCRLIRQRKGGKGTEDGGMGRKERRSYTDPSDRPMRRARRQTTKEKESSIDAPWRMEERNKQVEQGTVRRSCSSAVAYSSAFFFFGMR
mmetsp:Transcript_4894/g.31345  ORF Transcript_4894/g.31345 Transcript_4894/m.31345 type:complete len:90 (+) Transcript_4894:2367-2636(+)